MECNDLIPGQTGIINTIRYDINIQEIKNKIVKNNIPIRPHGKPG
jgi:hypothetical protein